MLLFAGILSRAPVAAKQLWLWFYEGGIKMLDQGGIKNVILIPLVLVLFLAIIAFIVFMTNAERRIPVQYAKRVVGRKMYGGQSTFIPIKVNMSGVMPIILAAAIVNLPTIISGFFKAPAAGSFMSTFLSWFQESSWVYIILYFVLIIAFAFFYVTIQYNPVEMANNLRKNSGAIPGYRPGKPTSDFIKRVLSKITLIGALFLGVIALFPSLFGKFSGFYGLSLGGTSIMIVVGVALETTQQIESQMMMRHYRGFLE
jgi:preprotein translocase subunit SecY